LVKNEICLEEQSSSFDEIIKTIYGKIIQLSLIHNSSDLGKNVLQEIQSLTTQYLIQLIDLITYTIIAIAILSLLLITDIKIPLAAIFLLGCSYALIYIITKEENEKSRTGTFGS
jgi:hypothetical protein